MKSTDIRFIATTDNLNLRNFQVMVEEEKKAPPADEEEEEAEPTVVQMKTGDYMVHIYIQVGKNFYVESEDTINPYIEIETCGIHKMTTTKKDVACKSAAVSAWREHLFFEPLNMHSSAISAATIEIKVKNKGVFKDHLVGVYEFDLSKIYFMADTHSLEHQWIALTNPEGNDFSEISGNLKISIAVQGPGDNQVQLKDQDGPEKPGQQILMPATVKKTFKQLKIRFIEARDLPKMDLIGTIDAYLECEYFGKKIKTTAVTAKDNICLIEQEIWLPVQWPLATDRLVFQLKDKDNVIDEVAGSIIFSLKEMIAKGSQVDENGVLGHYYWQNLYGSPIGVSGKYTDLMNENPEFASAWKGRILMHLEATDEKHPDKKVQPLVKEENIRKLAQDKGCWKKHNFAIAAEFSQGICLPYEAKFRIRVVMGDISFESTVSERPRMPAEVKKTYNRWSWRLPRGDFASCFASVDTLDKVFVYLLDDNKPICFWKGRVKDFCNPDPDFQWIALKADKAIGKVDHDYEAGMISMKMSIFNRGIETKEFPYGEQDIDFAAEDAWSKAPPKRFTSKKIRIFLFQCSEIPSADEDGASDCFISVWNPDNIEHRTMVIEDTLNPIYYETIEIEGYDVYPKDKHESEQDWIKRATPIIFNLWDQDRFGTDYLGRSVVYLDKASTNLSIRQPGDNTNLIPPPQWHDIRIGFDETAKPTGKILCSFVITELDFEFDKPARLMDLDALISKKSYNVDINVLGLRNLESVGIVPVRKAFVKMMVRSLLPPSKAHAVTNAKTEPTEAGPNPNINTCITFAAELPVEEEYCQSLACDCYDFLFAGLRQPLIGTFSIPIGLIKGDLDRKQRSYMKMATELLNDLRKKEKFDTKSLKQDIEGKKDLRKQLTMNLLRKKTMATGEKDEETTALAIAPSGKPQQLRTGGVGGSRPQMNQKQKEAQKSGAYDHSSDSAEDLEMQDKEDYDTQAILEDDGEDKEKLIDTARLSMTGGKIGAMLVKKQVTGERSLADLEAEYRVRKGEQAQGDGKKTDMDIEMEKQMKKECMKKKAQLQKQRKLQMSAGRELALSQAKERDDSQGANIVIIPTYRYNADLHCYEEDESKKPSADLYLSIGFNDLQVVQEMKEGSDKEKRSNKQSTLIRNSSGSAISNPGASRLPQKMADVIESQDHLEQLQRQKMITKQHYRMFYPDELENMARFKEHNPFLGIDIKRGQMRGKKKSFFKSLFETELDDDMAELNTTKIVGRFKGRVDVYNVEDRAEFEKERHELTKQIFKSLENLWGRVQPDASKKMSFQLADINDPEKVNSFAGTLERLGIVTSEQVAFFKNQLSGQNITQQLLRTTVCSVNCYLLSAFSVASRDIGSESDPYAIVRCGKTSFNERDNYQLDTSAPKFYKLYQFNASFPGSPDLVIECWDYDDLFGDDLIGETSIDLDDRFFNTAWTALQEKPVEYRDLWHHSTQLSQGTVACWVDIDAQEKSKKAAAEQKLWEVEPEPVRDYQLRLCVLDAEDIPMEDIEGTSDVYIKCYIDDKDKRTTDTHFRSTGSASWNYRFCFDLSAPRPDYQLVIQAWDFDLFKKNDYLCEWVLDLEPIFKQVQLTQKSRMFTREYYTGVFQDKMSSEGAKIEFVDDNTFNLITEASGKPVKLRLDLRLYPGADAKANPLGDARNDTNMEPFLPPPVGRISFSLNPFKMLSQLMGPALWNKIKGTLCCVCFLALCIATLPMTFSTLQAKIVLAIFGLN